TGTRIAILAKVIEADVTACSVAVSEAEGGEGAAGISMDQPPPSGRAKVSGRCTAPFLFRAGPSACWGRGRWYSPPDLHGRHKLMHPTGGAAHDPLCLPAMPCRLLRP